MIAIALVAGLATTAGLTRSAASPPVPTTAANDLAHRQLTLDRANRGTRPIPITTAATTQPATATATATPTPSPAASPTPSPKPKAPDWVNPMPGVELSSCFGPRWGTVHQGIDFAGSAGTAIRAVGAGTVIAAGWNYSGYGISVMIDHGNGLYSHYAHAEQALVTVGQHVVPGQTIALEGATGDATGPHLHFEIHEGLWNQVDPAPWLRAHGTPVGC